MPDERTAYCRTPGCVMDGVPVDMTGLPDDLYLFCGGCGQAITDGAPTPPDPSEEP